MYPLHIIAVALVVKAGCAYNELFSAVTDPSAECEKPVTPQEVMLELEKIKRSRQFRWCKKLFELLSYLVKTSLDAAAFGKGNGKMQECAIRDALYADHHPRSPIVRVETSRLRRKLAEYYVEDGRSDKVVVKFELGSYRPVFSRPTTLAAQKGALLEAMLLKGLCRSKLDAADLRDIREYLEASVGQVPPELRDLFRTAEVLR